MNRLVKTLLFSRTEEIIFINYESNSSRNQGVSILANRETDKNIT